MKRLRHHRKALLVGLATLGALVGTVTFVVVPALATPAGQTIKPPSTLGVLPVDVPTGGQSNDCAVFHPSGGPQYQYRITNPKSQTYTTKVGPNNTTVTFTLTINPSSATGLPAYANDKYVSVSSTGAAIADIGIKGGTDTARYNYSSLGFVTADGNLHAPAQSVDANGNPTSLYSVSNLTLCFDLGSTVSGAVFNDTNSNSAKDSGESGTPQTWTLNLYNGSTLVGSTPAAASAGAYQFTNVTPGSTYRVCIVGQTGWRQTRPTTSIPSTGTTACSGTNESARGYTFTMDSPKTGLDFGNVQLQSISGTAFVDTDGNSAKDAGESGQSSLTVTLYNGSGTSLGTATTQSDGTYVFTNQPVGSSYKVCISTPTPGAWIETLPASGASCSAAGQSSAGYSFTLAATGKADANFGHQPLGSVSGTVYKDVNQNGTNNAGDSPLSGWTVNLYKRGSLLDSRLSTANGWYKFALSLDPTSEYKICEVPPSGTWAESQPLPNTPNICSGSGELIKGWQFTPSTATDTITAQDFGNAPAVYEPCPPPTPFGPQSSGDVSYSIQLAACKPGQTFVFSVIPAVVDGDAGNTPPTVSVWVGDETQTPKVPLVEKIVFPFTIQPGATEPLLIMHYDDTFPFSVVGAPTMPFCNFDPRDPTAISNPDFTLQAAYTSHSGAGLVLPTGATSCLIVQTESSTRLGSATGPGTYTAYVYSELDGLRFGGP